MAGAFTVVFAVLIATTVAFTIWAARPLKIGGIISMYLAPAFLAAIVADAPPVVLAAFCAILQNSAVFARILLISELVYICALVPFVLWRFIWKDWKDVHKFVLYGFPIMIESLIIIMSGVDEMPWDYPNPTFSLLKHAAIVISRVCIMGGAWLLGGLTYRRFAYDRHMALKEANES